MVGPSAGQVILAHSAFHRGNCSLEDLAPLDTELSKIKARGCCVDSDTFGEGIASLAVPLVDAQGNVPGSICMVGPEFRLTPEKIETDLLPSLMEAGEVVSSKLGHVGHYLHPSGS
jgi:DNA-binding IclR family transcriptional regulator